MSVCWTPLVHKQTVLLRVLSSFLDALSIPSVFFTSVCRPRKLAHKGHIQTSIAIGLYKLLSVKLSQTLAGAVQNWLHFHRGLTRFFVVGRCQLYTGVETPAAEAGEDAHRQESRQEDNYDGRMSKNISLHFLQKCCHRTFDERNKIRNLTKCTGVSDNITSIWNKWSVPLHCIQDITLHCIVLHTVHYITVRSVYDITFHDILRMLKGYSNFGYRQ